MKINKYQQIENHLVSNPDNIKTNQKQANKIHFHTKNLQMEGNIIKWSSKAKYLGIKIGSKLHFTSHITNIINKTKAAKHCLFPIIYKR